MYLVIIDYTSGVTSILRDSDVNKDSDPNFDYNDFIDKYFKHCEVNWIVCDTLEFTTLNDLIRDSNNI
jgi:hypothetical protein